MTVFRKVTPRDVCFVSAVALITALCMILPSKLGTKGTSPGYTALNAILLTSNCTDITYEKYEPQAVEVLRKSLDNDLDYSGLMFWNAFIRERYGK